MSGNLPFFDPEATSIRAVIPTPRGGHLAMTGFPGLLSYCGMVANRVRFGGG